MENKSLQSLTEQSCPEELLSNYVAPKIVVGLDSVEGGSGLMNHLSHPLKFGKVVNASSIKHEVANADSMSSLHLPIQATEPRYSYSISVNMPLSPSGFHIERSRAILSSDESVPISSSVEKNQLAVSTAVNSQQSQQGKFPFQAIPAGKSFENQQKLSRFDSMKDKRFDSFKTCSGGLERQFSNLRGKLQEPDIEADIIHISDHQPVPEVKRYFDALEGPELDTLRASEVSVLPIDEKWPFLLRFPISSFGMCLGVSSQAMLWKTLSTSSSLSFLHVSPTVNLVLWSISLALFTAVSLIYSLKLIFYFEAVRREYYHPVRVNYFFAPWIACLFLALGVPSSVAVSLNPILWYVLMAPIFCLELKIYGQWMSRGKRSLSKVANPTNQLSIIGNFVGALLGATMGLKEGPLFFFAIGLAHYIVLFVTLYQRLPTNATLPKELHPVFFLFVAPPSIVCLAWAKIQGDFDYGSRMAYFVALFLYVSLVVRINFFRGFRFSLAWWAYTFPITAASIATIGYSMEVTNMFTQALSIGLSVISSFTVTALLVATIIHAFVLKDLFPNDIAIAITEKRPISRNKHKQLRAAS